MASDRSISLRLAVTGAEESLRALSTFGDTGQAAIQRLSDKFNAAGGAVDTLGQRITAQQRNLDALGAALDQVEKDRGGTGFVSGAGRDPNAEAQGFVAAEQAKQEALRQTAAAAAQEQAANERLVQQGAQLAAAFNPFLAVMEKERALTAAVAAGKIDDATKTGILIALNERARAQQAALNAEMEGSGKGFRNLSYVVGNVSNQVGDFFVQVAGGTGVIRALTQQLPQAAGAFALLNSSFAAYAGIAGAVIAIVGAAVTAFLGMGASQNAAADAAKEQQQSTNDLLQTLHVTTDSADAFAASIANLTAHQRDLVAANLSGEIAAQQKVLADATKNANDLIASKGQGAAVNEAIVGAFQGGDLGMVPQETTKAVQAIQQATDAVKRSFADFDAGKIKLDELKNAIVGMQQPTEMGAEEFRKFQQSLLDAASAKEVAKHDAELYTAQLHLLLGEMGNQGVFTQHDKDVLDAAQAYDAAKAAAKSYKDELADLRRQAHLAGLSPDEQSIANAIQKAGGDNLTEGQKADIAAAEGQRIAAQHAAEDNKKLKASEQELADQRRQLADATDKYAAAGDRAAASKRRELGEDLAQSDAGKAQIEQARQFGIEAAKQADARSAAANQEKYAAQVHQGLADAQRALAEAQRGGVAETREAIAQRQAENEVAGRSIDIHGALGQRLVEERTQTILLTQAAQDRLKFEQQIQALQARGAQAGTAIGVGAAGQRLDIGDLVGLSTTDLREVQERAAAVKQAVLAIPESIRNDAKDGPEAVARATQAAVDAYNKEAAAKKDVAAIDLGAQARQELQYAQQRNAAEQQAQPVRQQMLAQLQAENDLVQKGIDLDRLRYDPQVQAAYADDVRRRLQDIRTAEEDALRKREQQLTDDVIAQPFKDLASTIGGSLNDGLQQFETKGLPGLLDSLSGFAGKLTGIGNQFASNLLTLPLNKALAQFEAKLTATDSGGGFLAAYGQLTKDHPILAGLGTGGVIGGIGGSLLGSATGNQNVATGATLGATAGGVLGSAFAGTEAGAFLGPYGAIAGALAGLLVGALGGSLFGGQSGKNNDAQGFRYDPDTGLYTKTDKQGSAQNTQAARQLTENTASALDILRAAGLDYGGGSFQFKVGNASGIEYNGQKYASNQDALQAAIRDLIDQSAGTISDTLKTVLKNTTAENQQQLQQDIQFAQQYDVLTRRSGTYGQALSDLDNTYRTAEVQAQKLGLSTDDLAKALADAEKDLKDKAILSLRVLMGDAGPTAQAILNLRQQFKAANDDAAALGFTTEQLAAAEARQEQRLRDQAQHQFLVLTDQLGPFGQALLQLRDRFDQARQIAIDLGESTADLADKQAAAEAKLYRDSERQLQEQERGQAQQIRSFIDSLVSPLRQALSGLGPLAGFLSPTQGIASGLAEFRKTFALAGQDNVGAIQNLPQQAQQILQLARQTYGSSPEFKAIFDEVQRDLQSVLDAQQARGDRIESSIPDAIEQTGQQQIDTMLQGFGDTVDALRQLHQDFVTLNPGVAFPTVASNALRDLTAGLPYFPANGNQPYALPAGAAAGQGTAGLPYFPANGTVGLPGHPVDQTVGIEGNRLIAGVADAVRLGTDKQVAALEKGLKALSDRLGELDRTVRLLQPGRLGRAA